METLFDLGEQFVGKPGWSDMARSLSFSEIDILRWIMRLYTNSRPFDLDPTYSIGRIWQGLPQPRLKFDISPQVAGVTRADATALPLASATLRSVFFDPPFVIGPIEIPGKIRNRFSAFKSANEMYRFYTDAIAEFHRVLVSGGVLVFKCQDTVSGGKQHLSHVYIINEAARLGFVTEDIFILGRQNVMWSPNMRNQKHARKIHSYFLVMIKA